MMSRRVLVLLDVLCLTGVLWCGVLIGGLLGGAATLPTTPVVLTAAALVLPGFVAGILTNRRALRGRRPQSWFIPAVWAPPVELPRWGLLAAGAVLAAFWVAGLSAFAGMSTDSRPGEPAAHEVRAEQRFALGVLGGVGVGGTALAASTILRERRTGQRRTA
ncbi:hypothetical protein [Actinoplanes sp. RD1]|uniref:hypothetical protein n=1 Tax=Actinoplanes sp. RD1 TaxID=3064538 RepID=UPI002740F07A|nr:hypothetical protein [Actinoplanes sp. RD1]